MARQKLVTTHVLVQERDDAGEVIEAVLAVGICRGAVVGHDLVKVVEPVLVDHAQVGVLGTFDEFELTSRSGVTGNFSAMAPWSPMSRTEAIRSGGQTRPGETARRRIDLKIREAVE